MKYKSNEHCAKNDLPGEGNFAIEIKEINHRQQILIAANNEVVLQNFIDEIDDLSTFLKQIENFIALKDSKKIVKLLAIINKYFGGEQRFCKTENFELDLDCETASSYRASYENLQKLMADLIAIKNKINKEKITFIISELIESLN